MSDTPRTDAALLDAKLKHAFPNASFVHADFARELERERDQMFRLCCQYREAGLTIHPSTPQLPAAALTLLDEAIQELGKHYAPKDVIATKEGMDGWNGAVGYCIGTLLRMQDDRRGPQKGDAK